MLSVKLIGEISCHSKLNRYQHHTIAFLIKTFLSFSAKRVVVESVVIKDVNTDIEVFS